MQDMFNRSAVCYFYRTMNANKISYSVPWNLFLITLGCLIYAAALKGVIIPNGMITGGFSGLGLLFLYASEKLTAGTWYLILNIPVFVLGWKFLSKRFFLYSLYGMVILTLLIEVININPYIDDPWLVSLAGGFLSGCGLGLIFRSLGSTGGNDIITAILNQKFGVRIGTYRFAFNFLLFLFSFRIIETDMILYSMAISFISSQVIEYSLSLFNQRKMIIVISDYSKIIAHEINYKMHRGATFLKGQGAYTGKDKDVLITVANTFQIKRVEEIVYGIDSSAFMITENTFNVLGKGFSHRKIY